METLDDRLAMIVRLLDENKTRLASQQLEINNNKERIARLETRTTDFQTDFVNFLAAHTAMVDKVQTYIARTELRLKILENPFGFVFGTIMEPLTKPTEPPVDAIGLDLALNELFPTDKGVSRSQMIVWQAARKRLMCECTKAMRLPCAKDAGDLACSCPCHNATENK